MGEHACPIYQTEAARHGPFRRSGFGLRPGGPGAVREQPYCIQLNEGANPDTSGRHWYCDAVEASFQWQIAYLCEITYAARAQSLLAAGALCIQLIPTQLRAMIRWRMLERAVLGGLGAITAVAHSPL